MVDVYPRIARLLADWADHAERYWYPMPGEPGLGCYGTGYNAWGVQTNQKYVAAMAVLSVLGDRLDAVSPQRRDRARARALAALRFSLRSHVSGDYTCTDGSQWGHTWISGLGIERMMHGVYLLEPVFTEEDRVGLRRVLTSEADWLLTGYYRGSHKGIVGDPWNASGKNVPESNLWNAAILWRASVTYPTHPRCEVWREQAHRFLINAISVPADADDERVVAGRPIRERYVGANFFPSYGLDHHGYLNIGYMVICLSNAAMLHYDMQANGWAIPESLYHHNQDLWKVVRRFLFADGRLTRIGGDSRLRYTYCQEYLLPSLVYAGDVLDEPHAGYLIESVLEWIEREAAYNDGGAAAHRGSFYGRRLAPLIEDSPYYYTRLESDRACALGMGLAYMIQSGEGIGLRSDDRTVPATQAEVPVSVRQEVFERSVAGSWCEPDHGAVLHRSPSRLASYAWRAHGLTQGMCQPPDDGHLAEWSCNLTGLIRFLGDEGVIQGGQTRHRALIDYQIDTYEGGFITCGSVKEGVDLDLPEGWHGDESAVHQIAFAALPDGHTAIGLELCRTEDHRTYVTEVKGLHLNVPNDLFNGFERRLSTAKGDVTLQCPPSGEQVVELGSLWANLEGRLGLVGLSGAEQLVVHQSPRRRGGRYASLYVDEICYPCVLGTRAIDPCTVILDVGWAVLSDTDGDGTQGFAQGWTALRLTDESGIRGVVVRGFDGGEYAIVANFSEEQARVPLAALGGATCVRDLATRDKYGRVMGSETVALQAGRAHVFALEL